MAYASTDVTQPLATDFAVTMAAAAELSVAVCFEAVAQTAATIRC